jgi:hypothetical protein
MNSFLTKLMISRWVLSPFITPANFHDWATRSEFEIVRNQISMNRPLMLGLWPMPGQGHQVLCYGWDLNPLRLYIYDPNFPDVECTLTPESAALGCRIRGDNREVFYRGYFFMDVYNWNELPYNPPYKDIVITSGLSSTPDVSSSTNSPLSLSVTVQNIGEYPSRFRAFCIWARNPAGQNVDASVGGIEQNFSMLNPGQSRTVARNIASFAPSEGMYSLGVAKESNKMHWQDVPALNSNLVIKKTIRVWGSKNRVLERWIDVPESTRTDIATGIILRPGDEFALTGTGSIWAGVFFTGLNGPEGWNTIENNQNFPLHGTANARPFSLIGRFSNEGYFYIGNGLGRRAFRGNANRELLLRINDNTPSNGSGAFRCLIEVWR